MVPAIASNLSFAWYMTSPASALVNMLGVPAVGLPVVGAKYGMIKTGAKMAEYSKKFMGAGFKNQDGEWDYPSLANKKGLLNAAQQRAYDQFVIDGLIDVSLTHDVQGMTDKQLVKFKRDLVCFHIPSDLHDHVRSLVRIRCSLD
jgi:hypothetical protein